MKVFISFVFIFFTFLNISFSEENIIDKDEFLDIEKSIQFVIINQIKAFKSNDFELGYSYASENIKKIFPSYLTFKEMIIESYPMIYKPKNYEFVGLRIHAGSYFQRVLFIDNNNKFFYFDYQMIKNSDDYWLINGVYRIVVDQENV